MRTSNPPKYVNSKISITAGANLICELGQSSIVEHFYIMYVCEMMKNF